MPLTTAAIGRRAVDHVYRRALPLLDVVVPQLLVTTVYEGAPVGGLSAGQPLPDMPVDVGGLGRDVVSATTDATGTCTVEIADEGEWTVAVDTDVDGGRLRGLMTVRVAGPFALLALPVRFVPS